MNKSFGWVLVVLIILLLPMQVWIHFATRDVVVAATILGKERIVDGGESKYLVFTDKETFANEDALLALKFNSSDVYGKLQTGKICAFTVTGFRVPLFSWYRNILSTNCI